MARKSKTLPPGWKGTAHHPATPAQIRAIHTLKSALGMDDGPYRDIIARHGQGVMSSKDLTRKEASAVITELDLKAHGIPHSGPGPRPGKKPAKPVVTEGTITALATPMQCALIGHLIREVNWYAHGSYEDWLRKKMGLEKIVTKEEASNVIEGLKGLKKHGHAATSRPDA